MQGGLELAFMSTTVDKEEAMKYARRAPGMILFEIQQGFVARGASIAWLSQYPKEEEILMPPLTALEVAGTKIEGAVVVVELRPSVKPNDSGLKTGEEDIKELDAQRELKAQEAHEATQKRDREQQEREEAKKSLLKQMHWQQSMTEMRLAAARRKEATMTTKLARTKQAMAKKRWKNAADVEEKKLAEEQLRLCTADTQKALHAMKAADKRVQEASDRELKALKAKEVAEKSTQAMGWKMQAMGSLTAMRAAGQRAKSCADKLLELRGEKPRARSPPPPTVELDALVDEDDVSQMSIAELVPRLRDSIGPQEQWIVGFKKEDAEFAEHACDRLVELFTGKDEKKLKKAALEAGLFDELGYTMRKYADEPVVPFKAILALSALSSGANSKMQKGATHVFHAFMPAMRRLHDKGIEAVQALTKNSKENTKMAVRANCLVEWLSDDSNVRLDDNGKVID